MISKILNFLFPKKMNSVIPVVMNKSHCDVNGESERERIKSFDIESDEDKRIKRQKMEEIAKSGPVIIQPDNWINPVVARVLSINEDSHGAGVNVEVYDYLTGEKSYQSNALIPFTWRNLNAIDEISSLFITYRYLCDDIHKNHEFNYKMKKVVRTDMKDWKICLEKNNFFKDYPEYNI